MARKISERTRQKLQDEKHRAAVAQATLARGILGLGYVPVGSDSGADAFRALIASLLVLPPGKWHPDNLPLPIDWSAMNPVVLADSVLSSGRSDMFEYVPVDWVNLSREKSDDRHSYSRLDMKEVYELGNHLRAHQTNWMLERIFGFGMLLNDVYQTTPVPPTHMQERYLGWLEKVGVGPDTQVSAQVLGRSDTCRLVDVSFVHDSPKVQRRLLSTALWSDPKQAGDTLWALAWRFATAEKPQDKTAIHPSIKDGTLLDAMLDINPDPGMEISVSPSLSYALGLEDEGPQGIHRFIEHMARVEMGEVSGGLPPFKISLTFGLLMVIHANVDEQPQIKSVSIKKLVRWCEKEILASEKLLGESFDKLIRPAFHQTIPLHTASGPVSWSFVSTIENISTHLPPYQQIEIAKEGFAWAVGDISQRKAPRLKDLANSFPVNSTLPRRSLDLNQAQAFMRFLSRMELKQWKAPTDPTVQKVLEMFEEPVANVLYERIREISETVLAELASGKADNTALRQKVQLEGKVALRLDRAVKPSPSPKL